jgi:uncharacterized membrane protein (UPF0127 family)
VYVEEFWNRALAEFGARRTSESLREIGDPSSVLSKAGIALVAAVCLLLAGCGGNGPLERATALITTKEGEIRLDVEVAETAEARREGLMHRESLPERSGMLFLYEAPANGGFWMKNTLIPLSIAFLDADGKVVRILDMEPCEADPCRVYHPGVVYRAALEVNRGAFEEWGVAVGDRVTIER